VTLDRSAANAAPVKRAAADTGTMISRQALRSCPVCQAARVDVLHHQRFTLPEGHILSDGYDVVCCDTCGFVYADTAAKQADYDRFYAELSGYESEVSSGMGLSPQDRQRLEATAAAVAAAVPARDARILDFGCAGGGLIRALQAQGFTNIHGIDPSPACAAQVRAGTGVPAEAGSLFAIPAGLEPFDCIILTHVLEHVEDVQGALTNLVSLLTPDGLLHLEVPDAMRYADFIVAPFQDFNTEHINHFSLTSLDNACARAGLELVGSGEKLLESAPKMPYPAVYGFWRRGAGAGAIRQDVGLRPRIEEYVRRSRIVMDKYEARISALIHSSPELMVWGTGQLTMKLLNETSLGQARIAAFIDGNPINQGRTLHGVRIVAPDALDVIDRPILVASTIHYEAISRAIREKFGEAVEVVGLE
jgi:SAM-dependent methyltransferase